MRARAEQIEVEQATEDALYVKEVDNKMTKRSFLPMTKTKRRDTAVALDDETGRLSFYEQEQAKTSASRGAGTPGKFPERERAGCCAVFNPYADARIAWDTVALCFVMYVMFITPYQLAFIMNEPKLSEINKVFAPENKSRMPLMVIDSVVDLFFNPLVNIHLLGKEADGPFKRPFGAADGPPPNPLAAMMGSPPGGGAAPAKAT